MKKLETPNDIRDYIKEMVLNEFGNMSFKSINTAREITDKIIFAIDHYIDLKIDLALNQRLSADVLADEVKDIPDKLTPTNISKCGLWKNKKSNNQD